MRTESGGRERWKKSSLGFVNSMLEIIDFIVSEEKEMIWAGQMRVVSLTFLAKERPFELKATRNWRSH